jgi:hypothetical protein
MTSRLAACLISLSVVAVLATSAGPVSASVKAQSTAGYVNPFQSTAWSPSRTDMGVDWIPAHPTPVAAIGAGTIVDSENHASWPGKHYIAYQLTAGSHIGDVIYVAEHLKKLLHVGTSVHAGQRIATALPGYPWIETGWADQWGSPRAYPCYKDGKRTSSGKEMARFLVALGASVYDKPGKGSMAPTGKRC